MFAADPSALRGAIVTAVQQVPTNLEELARQMARAVTSSSVPATTGAVHAQTCPYCNAPSLVLGPPAEPAEPPACKCVERCAWPACPSDVTRDDPVNYSTGFGRPAVPSFKESA